MIPSLSLYSGTHLTNETELFEFTNQQGTGVLTLDNDCQDPAWRQFTPYGAHGKGSHVNPTDGDGPGPGPSPQPSPAPEAAPLPISCRSWRMVDDSTRRGRSMDSRPSRGTC
jgi:hypothetical protein